MCKHNKMQLSTAIGIATQPTVRSLLIEVEKYYPGDDVVEVLHETHARLNCVSPADGTHSTGGQELAEVRELLNSSMPRSKEASDNFHLTLQQVAGYLKQLKRALLVTIDSILIVRSIDCHGGRQHEIRE